ncbi:hypothetical protein D3C84_932660 [compost metagenome]
MDEYFHRQLRLLADLLNLLQIVFPSEYDTLHVERLRELDRLRRRNRHLRRAVNREVR